MLIKNTTICDKRGQKRSDVRLEDGRIKKISSMIEPKKNERIIDGEGLFLLPGIIDIGASIGEGVSDIYKALKKVSTDAVKGGATTVLIQPDTPINTEIGLDYFFSKSKELSLCSLSPVASATENNALEKLNNLAIIFKNGAIGAYIRSDANSNILKRSMEYTKMYSKPLFVTCANSHLDKGALIHDGAVSFRLGLGGFSVVSETSEMAKVVDIASFVGSKLLVSGVSSEKAVSNAAVYKKNYPNIFFDVSVHHLCLTDEACVGYNSYAKNYPPLREERDQKALVDAIKNSVIDVISSGHTPVSRLTKDLSFEDAAFGIESLGVMFSILYTRLVQSGEVSMERVSELTSFNPSAILGFENKGLIKEGYDADLFLFDPLKHSDVGEFSPYKNIVLTGAVTHTFKAGELIYEL